MKSIIIQSNNNRIRGAVYALIVLSLVFVGCSTVQNGDLYIVNKNQKVSTIKVEARTYGNGSGNTTRTDPVFKIYEVTQNEPAIVKIDDKTKKLTIDFLRKKPSIKELSDHVLTGETLEEKNLESYRPLFDRQYGKLLKRLSGENHVQPEFDIVNGEHFQSVKSKLFRPKLFGDGMIYKGTEFKYYRKSASWQATTIPFKYRFKTSGQPADVSPSFSVGLGYHMTTERTIYQPIFQNDDNTIVATEPSKRALSFSPFIGLTSVSLNRRTTGEALNEGETRTNFGVTAGFLITVDINDVDIGGGVGMDYGFGPFSNDWIYQAQPWIGVSLGLDIIK